MDGQVLSATLVELADTLVADFDVIDFLLSTLRTWPPQRAAGPRKSATGRSWPTISGNPP